MSSFDTISKLPDEVLCHILSFLSTKDAITTSILSKRWKRLWLSVPVLDFKEPEINEAQPPFHFCRMVYAAMLKRHVSQPVKRFCLSCLGDSDACDSSDVSTWVGAVIQRGVEDLDLTLAPEISLPSGIVGSRTLVVLKLAYLTIDDVFADGFPSLKMMELEYVLFKEHRHLTQLLFGCPILEVLEVVGPLVADFTEGEFPTLEKLVSADLSFSHTSIPWKWICNVKFLRVLEEFPSCKVTCTFSNLMILELIVKTYNLSWLVETLQHCPKLQSLAIEKRGGDNDDIDDNEWVQPQFVPECLSSHLRTCSLINYRGRERELQFSKYIMKNAKVLHTMRICCHTSANLVAKFEMIKKLSLCPRSSIACKLSFE